MFTRQPETSCGQRRSGEREQRREAIAKPLLGELLEESPRPRAPIASVAGAIAQHAARRASRSCARSPAVDEQPGVAVGDDLAGRAAAPTHGRPARIASTNTKPKPSSRLGITNARAASRTRGAAPRRRAGRERRTWAPRPSAAAFCSSRGRSSPSPTIRSDRARDGGGDLRPDLEQRVVPLVALVGRHPADDQRRRRTAGGAATAPGSRPRRDGRRRSRGRRSADWPRGSASRVNCEIATSRAGAIERRALNPRQRLPGLDAAQHRRRATRRARRMPARPAPDAGG